MTQKRTHARREHRAARVRCAPPPHLPAHPPTTTAQLMSGVLTDYKEGERMPSSFTSNLSGVVTALLCAAQHHKAPTSEREAFLDEMEHMLAIVVSFFDGVRSLSDTEAMFVTSELRICSMMQQWHGDVRMILGPFIAVKSSLMRMEQITATSFAPAVYSLLDINVVIIILCVGAADWGSPQVSVAILCFFTLLFSYISFLLRDLDSPFVYPKLYNTRCLQAGCKLPRSLLHETQCSCVDMGIVTVSFPGSIRMLRESLRAQAAQADCPSRATHADSLRSSRPEVIAFARA